MITVLIFNHLTGRAREQSCEIPSCLGFVYNDRMPTIKRIGNLRVVIYPNDHRPAHVHVIGNGFEAVFRLLCPGGSAELRENFGFPAHELGSIRSALIADLEYLCKEWRKVHGNP